MMELDPRKQAGVTKRRNSQEAFLDTAIEMFAEQDYKDIRPEDIARRAGRSKASFYNLFPRKDVWAAAVLDRRLNEVLDGQTITNAEQPRGPQARLAGHLSLLAEVSAPLPGITKGLVDERTEAQQQYSDLLPRYYGEVTQAIADGQEQREFNVAIPPSALADFALDSLALAYAVHLDNPAARSMSTSLVLASVRAAE